MIPLAIPALGALGAKLGTALTALRGAGAVRAGIAGIQALGKKGAVQGATRFAGDALKNAGGFIAKNAGNTKGEVAMRIAPDIFFGGMAGLQTPGDLGDKLIAGTTQAAGGALGGIVAGGAARRMGAGSAVQTMADMGGSVLGDYAGMYGGDAALRMKGGGSTPWEKVQQGADQDVRSEMERQILAQYGLAGYRPDDLFMAENGLA
tara:strand:+ start:1055 stop:1672 length:618 start_codon:yes stop_codon:yes gene_type:complete